MTRPPLRVLVDATHISPGGGLTFSRHSVEALSRRPEIRITLVAPRRCADELRSISNIVVLVVPNSMAVRFFFQLFVLPFLSLRHDVTYSLCNSFGPAPRSRRILCIQNLNVIGDARSRPSNRSLKRRINSLHTGLSMRYADRIVAISEAVRSEIAAQSANLEHKVAVVYSGMEPVERDILCSNDRTASPGQDPEPVAAVERYVAVLAADAPHKRFDDIVRAWSDLGRRGVALAIAGNVDLSRQDEIRAAASPSEVLFVGFISSRRVVHSFLRDAVCMVSASDLEAFPLPLVEAAAVSCPLVLSDIPAHREIAGGNATFFRVGEVSEIAARLREAIDNPRGEGHHWNWPYTWDDHAERLTALFREI